MEDKINKRYTEVVEKKRAHWRHLYQQGTKHSSSCKNIVLYVQQEQTQEKLRSRGNIGISENFQTFS